MEDLLWNNIKLHSKWNEIKKDKYYLKGYLSKHPEEMEKHIKEVETYETEVLKTPLYESDKKTHLEIIKNYKDELQLYGDLSIKPFHSYSSELLLYFLIFFCIGALLTIVGEEYMEKTEAAKEKGLREGFRENLDRILKRHGVSYEK
jgi:hypothetical protein